MTATAQTKSKLMGHMGQPGEPPFIWSLHSIYRLVQCCHRVLSYLSHYQVFVKTLFDALYFFVFITKVNRLTAAKCLSVESGCLMTLAAKGCLMTLTAKTPTMRPPHNSMVLLSPSKMASSRQCAGNIASAQQSVIDCLITSWFKIRASAYERDVAVAENVATARLRICN